ncbi:SIS domain-containing protein [Luedemannella flava]
MSTTQMAREIAEQPVALGRTLDVLIPLRPQLAQLAGGRRKVLFAARGTSDHAAIYGRYLLETHAGILGGLLSPSVATHYRSRLDLTDCVVVCVSQSGQTAEIVESEAWAKGCGAVTVAVTNVADSPLAANADIALVTQAGPELAVPATKSHTTQLAAMAVIGTALATEPEALDADLARIPAEVQRLLAADVADAVAGLRDADHVVVSGRGLMLGSALETALKLEETCLRPVRGYSYADFRHGPIAVVTSGVTAILLAAPDGPLLAPMTELASDLSSRSRHGRHRRGWRVREGVHHAPARPGRPRAARPTGRDRARAGAGGTADPRARPGSRQPSRAVEGRHHRPLGGRPIAGWRQPPGRPAAPRAAAALETWPASVTK